MSERYLRRFSLPSNLYSAGCPIMISAGALLLDTITDKTIVQLKLVNVSSKTIVAVKVKVTAFDAFFNSIGKELEFVYADMFAERDAVFGSKVPVWLPDSSAYSFSVSVTSVAFFDSSIWNVQKDIQWTSFPDQKNIKTVFDTKLLTQFVRNTTNQAQFLPIEVNGFWRCTCGGINLSEELNCHICSTPLLQQKASLDIDLLNEQLTKKETEDFENQNSISKSQSQKTKKNLLVFSCIIVPVFIVALYFIINFFSRTGYNTEYVDLPESILISNPIYPMRYDESYNFNNSEDFEDALCSSVWYHLKINNNPKATSINDGFVDMQQFMYDEYTIPSMLFYNNGTVDNNYVDKKNWRDVVYTQLDEYHILKIDSDNIWIAYINTEIRVTYQNHACGVFFVYLIEKDTGYLRENICLFDETTNSWVFISNISLYSPLS